MVYRILRHSIISYYLILTQYYTPVSLIGNERMTLQICLSLHTASPAKTKLFFSAKLLDSISKIKNKFKFAYLKDEYLVFVYKKNSEEIHERSKRLGLI